MAEEQRTTITIEGFSPGDEGKPTHFNALASREEAAAAAKDIEVGDAAFIKRSDLKWTYAILVEKDTEDSEGTILRFDVDMDKNRKSFPEKQWGKYIRVISKTEEAAAAEAVKEEETDDESTKVSTLSDSLEVVEKPEEEEMKPDQPVATGWFTGIFGSAAASQQSHPTVSTSNSLKESVKMPLEEASVEVEAPVAVEEPVEEPAVEEASVAEEPVVEEEDKENDAPATPAALKKTRSIFNKISFSRSPSKQKKVTIETPTESKKEYFFDPHASEVDYDKNPTDLFQALEARQWQYAVGMAESDIKRFNKDCSTWVVAQGKKKGSPLRFRALPLHAAVVFGAPGDLVKTILDGYPLAARGRDVKGRLPCHLACEHEASDEVLVTIISAFPKAFYANDKLGKTPLDYMNDNGNRKWIKMMIPSLLSVKVEDEKTKWDAEKEQAILKYRETLKSDPDYTKEVAVAVEEKTETKYANKFELIELTHKKEIELLKMKHAEETRALLEGFEVKLHFEKRLQRLNSKK